LDFFFHFCLKLPEIEKSIFFEKDFFSSHLVFF